jgi:hypothetical protein
LVELAAQVAQEALAELAAQVAQEALAELVAQVAQEALAELAVLGALAGLAVRVELAGLVVQVELELKRVERPELAPVAVELARGQVEAVPERDPVALLAKNKSVTAAHHPGQVPVPKRVEDLAAAAETTREPAATEAAAAWAAAV